MFEQFANCNFHSFICVSNFIYCISIPRSDDATSSNQRCGSHTGSAESLRMTRPRMQLTPPPRQRSAGAVGPGAGEPPAPPLTPLPSPLPHIHPPHTTARTGTHTVSGNVDPVQPHTQLQSVGTRATQPALSPTNCRLYRTSPSSPKCRTGCKPQQRGAAKMGLYIQDRRRGMCRKLGAGFWGAGGVGGQRAGTALKWGSRQASAGPAAHHASSTAEHRMRSTRARGNSGRLRCTCARHSAAVRRRWTACGGSRRTSWRAWLAEQARAAGRARARPGVGVTGMKPTGRRSMAGGWRRKRGAAGGLRLFRRRTAPPALHLLAWLRPGAHLLPVCCFGVAHSA